MLLRRGPRISLTNNTDLECPIFGIGAPLLQSLAQTNIGVTRNMLNRITIKQVNN
jgi:hypothetical protein